VREEKKHGLPFGREMSIYLNYRVDKKRRRRAIATNTAGHTLRRKKLRGKKGMGLPSKKQR